MSYKSLFADTAPKQTKAQKREAQVAREIEAGGLALAAAVKPSGPVAIQYGAEAVLNSLTARPAPEHQGQTFEEFVSDVKARHPAPVAISTQKSKRGGKKGQKSERKPCREACGNVAPYFSETGLCITCEDKAENHKLVQAAGPVPIITARASYPYAEPGQYTHREVIAYKGQAYEFDVNRRAKTGEPCQDYLNNEAGDGAATLTGDEYTVLLNYAQGLIKRAEANDMLRELARVKAMPERHFVSTHEERCAGLMREVMAQMPLSWLLTYIENHVGQMPPELVDCKFRRAK